MPPPGPTREAVVAVIVRGHQVLFIRRSAGVPDPGYWAPPSGSIEPGESQEAAVVREVREEVGLTVRPERIRSTGGARSTWPERSCWTAAKSLRPAGSTSRRSMRWSRSFPSIVPFSGLGARGRSVRDDSCLPRWRGESAVCGYLVGGATVSIRPTNLCGIYG